LKIASDKIGGIFIYPDKDVNFSALIDLDMSIPVLICPIFNINEHAERHVIAVFEIPYPSIKMEHSN
jgi:hypothetical protein